MWKTVVWHNQNFQKLHLYLQKPKDRPGYHKHQKQPIVYVSESFCVAHLFVCSNFFSQSNYSIRPSCFLSLHSKKRTTISTKVTVSEVIFSIVCAIKEKVNLLWLIVKVIRIKAAFGNCYLRICLEIVNPRDTGWVWGSKLVMCHQKEKALKVI